jgi:CRP-like cAMP-binding protein
MPPAICHPATLSGCPSYCELFVLHQDDFDESLEDYPQYRERMMRVAVARAQRTVERTKDE